MLVSIALTNLIKLLQENVTHPKWPFIHLVDHFRGIATSASAAVSPHHYRATPFIMAEVGSHSLRWIEYGSRRGLIKTQSGQLAVENILL